MWAWNGSKQSFVCERWWRVHSTEHSTLLGSGILTRQPHHAPPPCSAKRENPTKGERCTIPPHVLSMLHYPQYTKVTCKANIRCQIISDRILSRNRHLALSKIATISLMSTKWHLYLLNDINICFPGCRNSLYLKSDIKSNKIVLLHRYF